MALMITDRCINCGYCVMECPNSAIYEPQQAWSLEEGTGLNGTFKLLDGGVADAVDLLDPLSESYYFIVPDKCAECTGFFEDPQCIEVCPDPDCIVVNPVHKESKAELLEKQSRLNRNRKNAWTGDFRSKAF